MQLPLFLKGLKTITRINIVTIGITFITVSLNQPTLGIQQHLNSSKTICYMGEAVLQLLINAEKGEQGVSQMLTFTDLGWSGGQQNVWLT